MRVRIRFAKQGKIRWTSQRDVARMWERAFRRVRLPLAYTEGFSPRPKVSFGLALPTGCESVAEYLDVELAEGAEVGSDEDLRASLDSALPDGVSVTALAALDGDGGSLQQEVTACGWEMEVVGEPAGSVRELVDVALGTSEIPVTRQRKGQETTDDLRPALLGLEVLGAGASGTLIAAELATQPRGVRPNELLQCLGGDLELVRACRMKQWIERDGARREPLPLVATDAPHALVRAS